MRSIGATRVAITAYAVVLVVTFGLAGIVPRVLVLLVLAPALATVLARYIRIALPVLIPMTLLGPLYLSGSENLALPAAVIGIWLLGVVLKRWQLVPWIHATILFLAATVFISSLNANSPIGRVGLVDLILALGLLAVSVSVRPSTQSVLIGIGISGWITALVILTGAFGGRTSAVDPLDSSSRVIALGNNPNGLGMILALGATAWVGLAWARRNLFLLLLAIPAVLALPPTRSREGLFLLLIGVGITLLAGRSLKSTLATVGVAAALLAFFPSVPGAVYNWTLGVRADAQLQESDETRLVVAQYAVEQGLTHPLFGIGYNNFTAVAAADRQVSLALNTHNDYLRILAEVGIPSLLAWLLILVSGVRFAFRLSPRTAFPVLIVYVVILAVGNMLANPAISLGPLLLIGTLVGQGQGGDTVTDRTEVASEGVGSSPGRFGF